MLFDSFEAYDVQETRRVSRAEGKTEGEWSKLISQVCKKISKNCSIAEIAEMLEEPMEIIQQIYDTALLFAPDYEIKQIYEKLVEKNHKQQKILSLKHF